MQASRCLTNEDTMVPAMGMSENCTEEYTKKMRARYARMTGSQAWGRLHDGFVEITGWERKYANKVLLGKRWSKGRRRQMRCAAKVWHRAHRGSQNLLAGHGAVLRETHARHASSLGGAPRLPRVNPPSAWPNQCRVQ